MKQTMLIIFVLSLAVFVFSCSKKSDKIKIGIIQITDDQVLDIARKGAIKALEDSGFKDGDNIEIDYKNAQGDISNIVMILNSFKSAGVDLIITNSTPCMTAAVQNVEDIPVVFTVSFSPEQTGIKEVPANITGFYDPFEMEEFVKFIKQIIPNAKKIGVPLNPSEPNAVYASGKFKAVAQQHGFEIIEMSVSNSNEIITAGQALAEKGVDAMVVTADNTVYSGLNTLSTVCKNRKIPLFVTDAYQAEKGAAFGFGLDYSDWGYQSGLYAVEILNGVEPIDLPISPLNELQIVINKQFNDAIGLKIPDEIVKKANKVF